MKTFVCAVLLGMLCIPPSIAKESSPKVQVYSREPGHFDKDNTLICHVSASTQQRSPLNCSRTNRLCQEPSRPTWPSRRTGTTI
ncbi:hypothetical protein FQN60_002553 [Etheostoma spectabile]|uniref:Beta-2-microglobulin n=1 Tax=Etheostoma spectabile TaxID=54343 RepID=A0A5J5CBD9_9PERO|nr:hypothetical protein FQN60_002553 [Etheostoma spectabile]